MNPRHSLKSQLILSKSEAKLNRMGNAARMKVYKWKKILSSSCALLRGNDFSVSRMPRGCYLLCQAHVQLIFQTFCINFTLRFMVFLTISLSHILSRVFILLHYFWWTADHLNLALVWVIQFISYFHLTRIHIWPPFAFCLLSFRITTTFSRIFEGPCLLQF